MLHFEDGPKRPTNLSLNSKVLDMARELGINISQTVDTLLAEEVRRRYMKEWVAQNRQAIDAYNARIERDGTFSQQIQEWVQQQGEDGTI